MTAKLSSEEMEGMSEAERLWEREQKGQHPRGLRGWSELEICKKHRASPVAQQQIPPATQEMPVLSLGPEDPRRRQWQPSPVFLPGKPTGQKSLAGYSPCGCKEPDTTAVT